MSLITSCRTPVGTSTFLFSARLDARVRGDRESHAEGNRRSVPAFENCGPAEPLGFVPPTEVIELGDRLAVTMSFRAGEEGRRHHDRRLRALDSRREARGAKGEEGGGRSESEGTQGRDRTEKR